MTNSQLGEHVVAVTGGLSIIASLLLRWIPPPSEVKDVEGNCPKWYMFLFNTLRRMALNAPYISDGPVDKAPLLNVVKRLNEDGIAKVTEINK